MRTLSRYEATIRAPVRGSRPSRVSALIAVLGCALAVAGTVLAGADPVQTTQWAYRTTLRARGGTFESYPAAVLQSGLGDCGPAALANLLIVLGGTPPPVDGIGSLAGTGARGTTFAGLSEAARRLGVPNRLLRMDPASQLSTPFIAWVDRGHFVTVVPDSSDSVLVLDPQAGPYRIEASGLARYWSGEALVPEPVPPRGMGSSPTHLTGGRQ